MYLTYYVYLVGIKRSESVNSEFKYNCLTTRYLSIHFSGAMSLFQTVDSQQQLLRFLSLFAGSIYLVSSYAWFGQQVINEVGCMISTALFVHAYCSW